MRAPPHSEETEQAVLACVLLKPALLEETDLRAGELYQERHQLLFTAFRELSAEGVPIDLRTVQAHLELRHRFESAGGLGYLTGLDLVLPNLGHFANYAQTVRGLARRRDLIELGHRLASQAEEGTAGVDRLASVYRRRLEDLEAGGADGVGVWASSLVSSVLEDAASRRAQRESTGEAVLGLRTGIPQLDQLLCGLNRGLYLLAGAPGVGKTSLALQIALHVAREVPVVYATFENSASSLVVKTLCSHAGVKPMDVSRGYGEPSRLSQAAEDLGGVLGRLQLVEGDGGLTVGRLRALARRALEHGGGSDRCLVVVDYLQLWAKVSQELRSVSDVRSKVDALGGELIDLARRLGSPVLALSSQSRAGGNYARGGGSSSLASLKESGDLEYAADVALFLTPESESVGEQDQPVRGLELSIGKNRHGPTGTVGVTFQADRGLFRETDRHRA